MHAAFRFAILAAGIVALMGFRSVARAATDVGQAAPSLVVQELDGQAFDLGAMRGKVVVVNFWATWCPPCRAEMPALDAFYRRYRSQGLEMIGLSADRPHDRPDVLKVMQSFSYPAAMLDEAKVNGFGEPNVLPVTFVVDSSGVVRAKLTPGQTPVTAQTLTDVVLGLLPQEPGIHPPLNPK